MVFVRDRIASSAKSVVDACRVSGPFHRIAEGSKLSLERESEVRPFESKAGTPSRNGGRFAPERRVNGRNWSGRFDSFKLRMPPQWAG
jgi:hypothetical protein